MWIYSKIFKGFDTVWDFKKSAAKSCQLLKTQKNAFFPKTTKKSTKRSYFKKNFPQNDNSFINRSQQVLKFIKTLKYLIYKAFQDFSTVWTPPNNYITNIINIYMLYMYLCLFERTQSNSSNAECKSIKTFKQKFLRSFFQKRPKIWI